MTIRWLSSALLVLCGTANAGIERLEISVDSKIEVSPRSRFTLADLVHLRGGDESIMKVLESRTLESLDSKAFRKALREMKSEDARFEAAVFRIPEDVLVRKTSGYSGEEFRRKLMNRLSAACSDCSYEIQTLRDQGVEIPGDWKFGGADIRPAGSLLVTLVSESSGRTAWIPVTLKIRRTALVLKRTIPAGQRVLAEDFEARLVDASFAKEAPAPAEEVIDRLAARHLAAGTALYPSDLKREDAVKRGQIVKLSAGGDEFEILVTAMAEQNGRVGDVIKVKNQDSGKILSAVVSGNAQVRLQ